MASEKSSKLRRIYGIFLSCVIVLAGICLMVACVGIYRSGDAPFSREAVAAAFSPIKIPVYLCLAAVAVGLLWKFVAPLPAEKAVPVKQLSVIHNRLLEKADLDTCDSACKDGILTEQKKRTRHSRICAAVLTVSAAVFLSYALDGSHFHTSEINTSMIRAMCVLLPCLIVSFAACVCTVAARKKSLQKEIDLLKQCPKLSAPKAEPVKADHTAKVRYALLLISLALAVFGFLSGGTADVLTKAVNICTECIGLG